MLITINIFQLIGGRIANAVGKASFCVNHVYLSSRRASVNGFATLCRDISVPYVIFNHVQHNLAFIDIC